MEVKLTLTELRKLHISAKAVGLPGKLGLETDTRVLTLARILKKAFDNHKCDEEGNTVTDMIDILRGSEKLLEEHRKAAFKEANGNPEKQSYILQEKIALDERIADYTQKEKDLFKQVITLNITPVKVDLSAVEMVQKYLHRDEKEYVFDMQLVFPSSIEVEFLGTTLYKNPLSEFMDLIIEGYIERVDAEPTPADVLKSKIKKLK